ncbi:hypothetical protein F2Q70_00042729, partial [Brassica cretica]
VGKDPLTVKTHHLKDKPYEKDDEVIIKATYFEDNIGESNYRKLAEFLLKKRRKLTDSRAGIFEAIDFNYQKLADFGAGISDANKHKIQEESTAETDEDKKESTSKTDEDKKESGSAKKTKISDTFRKRIEPITEKIPKHVLKVMEEELAKLDRKEADYGSTSDIYSYLDWLTTLPWGKCRISHMKRTMRSSSRQHTLRLFL